MSELQLHRFNLPPGCFSPSISVPENKVSCRSERDRGDGTEGVQLFFIITVLSHVILAIFIPGGEEEKNSTCSPNTYETEMLEVLKLLLPVDQNEVKCVTCCFCDSISNILQRWSPWRGHSCDARVSVCQSCVSVRGLLSRYVVCLSKDQHFGFFP